MAKSPFTTIAPIEAWARASVPTYNDGDLFLDSRTSSEKTADAEKAQAAFVDAVVAQQVLANKETADARETFARNLTLVF